MTARNDDDRTQSGPHIPELLAVLWKRPWWAAGLIMAVGAVTGAASALLMPRGPV